MKKVWLIGLIAVILMAIGGCDGTSQMKPVRAFTEKVGATWSRMTGAVERQLVVGYDKPVKPGDYYAPDRHATRREVGTITDRLAEYVDKRIDHLSTVAWVALIIAIIALILAIIAVLRLWDNRRAETERHEPEVDRARPTTPTIAPTTTTPAAPAPATTPSPATEKTEDTSMGTGTGTEAAGPTAAPTAGELARELERRDRDNRERLIVMASDHGERMFELAMALATNRGEATGLASSPSVVIHNDNSPGFSQTGADVNIGDRRTSFRRKNVSRSEWRTRNTTNRESCPLAEALMAEDEGEDELV